MPMIFKFDGGLGNQIFQYAFVRWTTRTRGCSICLISPNSDRSPTSQNRALQVDELFPDCQVKRGLLPSVVQILSLSSKFQNWVGQFMLRHFDFRQVQTWPEVCAFLDEAVNRRLPVITGFFLFPVPIMAERGDLRKAAWPTIEKRWNKISAKLSALQIDLEKDCVIHVRRGDYVKWGIPLLGSDYYRNAALSISDTGMRGRYFFCSDDPEAAQEILINAGVDALPLPLEDPMDVLTIFCLARFKIIANSTLSFAGAYLGEDAATVYPEIWPGQHELSQICSSYGWTSR